MGVGWWCRGGVALQRGEECRGRVRKLKGGRAGGGGSWGEGEGLNGEAGLRGAWEV
jgi:hypothetical protein